MTAPHDPFRGARVDRTALVVSSLGEAESEDRAYWLARTPEERLRHVELLRRINYGDRATGRLQRVLEVATVEWR